MVVYKKQTKYKDTCTLKMHEQRKIYHSNTNQKKGVALLILIRADCKARKVSGIKKDTI